MTNPYLTEETASQFPPYQADMDLSPEEIDYKYATQLNLVLFADWQREAAERLPTYGSTRVIQTMPTNHDIARWGFFQLGEAMRDEAWQHVRGAQVFLTRGMCNNPYCWEGVKSYYTTIPHPQAGAMGVTRGVIGWTGCRTCGMPAWHDHTVFVRPRHIEDMLIEDAVLRRLDQEYESERRAQQEQ